MARTTVVPTRATASEIVSFEDLRDLASARKPCITVALAIPEPLQAHARIRNVIREVDRLLGEANISRETADTLTEPIRALGAETEDDGKWSTGLLLFRSRDQFRYFSAHRPL